MENTFQTSFIPKKPLTVERSVRRPMSFFFLLSVIALIGMGVAAGGLYFYKSLLVGQIAGLQKSLASAKDSFEPETIADLQLFDKRVSVSKQVLMNHMVFSPLFNHIAELTVPSIQFTSFTVGKLPETAGQGFSVTMSGVALDYKSIALQAQIFNSSKSKYFKDVVFSNLALSENKELKGYVTFNVTFTVDPALLSYEKQVLTKPVATQ